MQLPVHSARPSKITLLTVALPLAVACGDPGPAAPNTAPVVEITTPETDVETNDPDYAYDGYDDTQGLWYKDVLLEGAPVMPRTERSAAVISSG